MFGMTTSTYNSSAGTQPREERAELAETPPPSPQAAPRREVGRTVASRFIILTLCLALVLSTLAYGTVHYWALAVFQAGAALLIFFWAVDAWRSRLLRLSGNYLQLPLVGLILLGLLQLLPLVADAGAVSVGLDPVKSISLDPYSTRLIVVHLVALLIYFAAALAFIDSPRRLRVITYTIIFFGFALAIFGLIQSFLTPTRIYGIRELGQSTSFGPFINRHHFAAYMEMSLAVPAGLLLSGAIEREKRLLYAFAAAMMAIALVMTNSRGGIISLVAEVGFLFIITAGRGSSSSSSSSRESGGRTGRARSMMLRAGLAFALLLAIFSGVIFFGGEEALSRFIGTVNSNDPTTGRVHFWRGTLQIIGDHPFIGTGLGSFGVAYTLYDTRNGLYRLEQSHNDYLQILSDAGIVGAVLGLAFLFMLFRTGFMRRESDDQFRSGVATGALAGCFAVLVHSFFDFTLHTAANSLLFLTLAALATLGERVEQPGQRRRRRRRRHRESPAA
jgi:O-antigen ligase